VGVTGSALTNHTMDHLLSICNPNAYVAVLGDRTPLSPVLFDYGVDAISGTMAVDSEQPSAALVRAPTSGRCGA